jgi:membrane protein DedA with SNARE-associated domain
MPLVPFLLYTTLGAGIWTAVLTGAGYLLGENFRKVEEVLGPVSTTVFVLLGVAFFVWVARRKRHGGVQQGRERVRG